LEGTVDGVDLAALLAGAHPGNGDGLVAGMRRAGRVPGFDLTFSAPKSVSLAWALADPDVAERIAGAHDRAVADAVSAFQSEAVRARRGRDGVRQVDTDGVAAAAFAHRTSRVGDPELHTHVVVANVTVDHSGRWSAPDGRRIYGWAKTIGFLYQAALRHHLSEALGVEWGPISNGAADLAGFTKAQLEQFSHRRSQITGRLDQLGYTSARAAAVATLDTRPAKEPATTLGELRQRWAQQAASMDLPDIDTLLRRGTPRVPDPSVVLGELVGPGGLTKGSSSFDRRDVLQGVGRRPAPGGAHGGAAGGRRPGAGRPGGGGPGRLDPPGAPVQHY
jgi:conjugative relaxase-like TrwC/TraI family protein